MNVANSVADLDSASCMYSGHITEALRYRKREGE